MRKNAKKKAVNFLIFCILRIFFAIFCNFLNCFLLFVLSVIYRKTVKDVNLQFLRLFFAMHQNLHPFLFHTSKNLQWAKVNFTTVNLLR
jgi:hypothetical protein